MKKPVLKLRNLFVATAVAALLLATAAETPAIDVGNALSKLTDAKAAGTQAAAQAKAALGNVKAKAVIVFAGPAIKDKQQMLEGVCSVFDAEIVSGCSAYNPITQQGNTGHLAVMAIGGDVQITAAISGLEGGHEACGKRIGETLEKAAGAETAGRLLLLFGACHVPSNDKLVKGACSVLGEKFPIAGGAALQDVLYHQGKVLKGQNLGLLLTGNFRCGLATKKDMSPEGLINSAKEAFSEAIASGKGKPVAVLAFDCGGRRGKMGDNLPKELDAMKAAAGDAAIFGFYGSGEIGPADNDSPSRGVGYSISACAICNR